MLIYTGLNRAERPNSLMMQMGTVLLTSNGEFKSNREALNLVHVPEVRRTHQLSSVGQDFTLARLNSILNSTCFSRGHDRAAFVQAFPHLVSCDKDLSMPFF